NTVLPGKLLELLDGKACVLGQRHVGRPGVVHLVPGVDDHQLSLFAKYGLLENCEQPLKGHVVVFAWDDEAEVLAYPGVRLRGFIRAHQLLEFLRVEGPERPTMVRLGDLLEACKDGPPTVLLRHPAADLVDERAFAVAWYAGDDREVAEPQLVVL